MHPIEHEISAYYDITHGLGLAIIMPRYLRIIQDEKSLPRFKQLGIHALGLSDKIDEKEAAQRVISMIEDLCFNQFELQDTFTKLDITDEFFEEIASKLAKDNGYFTSGYRKLSKKDIVDLLKDCL